MNQLHSIQVLVDGEPVTVIFKSLKTGLKVAKTLSEAFQQTSPDEVQTVEQMDQTTMERAQSDAFELVRYTRSVSSYLQQQPLFIDVNMNHVDFRLNIPRQRTCRTSIAAFDQQTIQDLIKNQAPPPRPQIPALIVAAITPSTSSMDHSAPQLQAQITELSKTIYQLLVAVFQRDPNLLVTASTQVNIPIDRANSTQISHLIQQMTNRLIALPFIELSKLVQDFSTPYSNLNQTREKILELTQRLRLQENSAALKPKFIPQPIQLPNSLPNIPKVNINPGMGPTVSLAPVQIPQINQQWKQQHQPMIQTMQQKSLQQQDKSPAEIKRQKIQQTETVLETIMPERIATLLHGSQSFPFCKQMTTQVNERNTVSLNEKYKGKPYVQLKGVVSKVCEAWQNNVSSAKQGAPIQDEDALNLSEKIIKLYEVIGQKHVNLVKSSPLQKFHQSFTPNENLLLLLLVQKQLHGAAPPNPESQFDFVPLYHEMHDNFCLTVFDKLYTVIQQVGQVQKKIQQPITSASNYQQNQVVQQQYNTQMTYNMSVQQGFGGSNLPMPGQGVFNTIPLPQPSQSMIQVKPELPSVQRPHVTAPSAPAAVPPPPQSHHHSSSGTHNSSHSLSKQQMNETQGLIRSNTLQYQELKQQLPISDIFKALILIISIGDEYKKDINIIRQLLLQECGQIIKKMSFSSAMDGEKLKTIFVQLLSGFLNYIKTQKIQTQDENHRKQLMLRVDQESKAGRFAFEEIVEVYKNEVLRVNSKLAEIKMAFDPTDWKDQFASYLAEEQFYYVEMSQIKNITQLEPTEEMMQYCIDTSPIAGQPQKISSQEASN